MTTSSKTFLLAEDVGTCNLCQIRYVRGQELVELESKQEGLKVILDMRCHEFLKAVL